MAGSHVKIAAADGGSLDSYVAAPANGKGVGVVVVSTISGVDSDMIQYADALAAEGFVASAPDMFWRDADPGPLVWNEDGRKRAFARNGRYDLDLGMRDLADVIAHLKKHPQCNGKIAVMGFCFGSPFALLAAARYGTDAGISFHGSHVENHLDEAARARCPLSFHYGDRDEVAPMAAIERIQEACARPCYKESGARTAWARTLEVLRRLK
jgi:carboxymethylenebutenolidase